MKREEVFELHKDVILEQEYDELSEEQAALRTSEIEQAYAALTPEDRAWAEEQMATWLVRFTSLQTAGCGTVTSCSACGKGCGSGR